MKWQIFKTMLVVTNIGVLVRLCMLIDNHIRCQYNLKSFSFIFYVLSFMWLTIRGIFWISTMSVEVEWTSAQYYFLYWMPVPIEFGSFMLLPLYFAQIIYPEEWKTYYKTGRRAYGIVVLGLTLCQVIYIMMELVHEVNCCPILLMFSLVHIFLLFLFVLFIGLFVLAVCDYNSDSDSFYLFLLFVCSE